jgi:hypothetical protein
MARVTRQQSIQLFAPSSKPLNEPMATRKRKACRDEAENVNPCFVAVVIKKPCIKRITPPETPTKACKRALASLSLSVSPIPLKSFKRKRELTPEDDAHPQQTPSKSAPSLPPALDDWLALNSAFLTALSLHYAHNGAGRLLDTRTLIESITKVWGKRRVRLDDLQILIAVLHKGRAQKLFCLREQGGNKVFLEYLAGKRQRGSSPVNENALRALFNRNIATLWESFLADNPATTSPHHFLTVLPFEPLTSSASAKKLGPVRARGQQRLEEVLTPLKQFSLDDAASKPAKRAKVAPEDAPPFRAAAVAAAAAAPIPIKEDKPAPAPAPTASDRAVSLLARVRAKEAHALLLAPTQHTPAERARRAALARAPELLDVLRMLAATSGGVGRASFPLASVVGSVRASLRSPMSREDVEEGVRVLAAEVAPGAVKMVVFGKVCAVVVEAGLLPGREVVRERVRGMGVVV